MPQNIPKVTRAGENMLEIVEQNQQPLVGQLLGDVALQTECLPRLIQDQRWIAQ